MLKKVWLKGWTFSKYVHFLHWAFPRVLPRSTLSFDGLTLWQKYLSRRGTPKNEWNPKQDIDKTRSFPPILLQCGRSDCSDVTGRQRQSLFWLFSPPHFSLDPLSWPLPRRHLPSSLCPVISHQLDPHLAVEIEMGANSIFHFASDWLYKNGRGKPCILLFSGFGNNVRVEHSHEMRPKSWRYASTSVKFGL